MTAMLSKSVRDWHERENVALANALRARAKGLVCEINRERGEGYLYLSECVAVGFFMLFERMPMTAYAAKMKQAPDWAQQLMIAGTDLDGYARLVLRLEEMKGVNV